MKTGKKIEGQENEDANLRFFTKCEIKCGIYDPFEKCPNSKPRHSVPG